MGRIDVHVLTNYESYFSTALESYFCIDFPAMLIRDEKTALYLIIIAFFLAALSLLLSGLIKQLESYTGVIFYYFSDILSLKCFISAVGNARI